MIPAPPLNNISLGPITIHFYGIIIALAITSCYFLATRLAKRKNISLSDFDSYIFTILPISIIGARIYHVGTNWDYYKNNMTEIPAIWSGGLGMFGAIVAGIITLYILTKIKKQSFTAILDLIAVTVPLGQAIGRWGNYFNQELFGKPTSLPWALYVDPEFRPQGLNAQTTYHPTFLYESLLNALNFAILYYAYTKKQLKAGSIVALYFINYGIIRLLIESIKIDPDISAQIGPLRVPQYISLLLILAGISTLLYLRRRK